MTLKKTSQVAPGVQSDMAPDGSENNEGAEFGTSDRATRGTDRDLDRTGTSQNQGHGHTREERGEHG